MVSVNLLPAEIAQKRAAARRVHVWTLVVLLAGCAASAPVAMNLTRRAQASALAKRCAGAQESRSTLQKELIATVRECDALDRHLARSETLRTKRSWSALLAFVSACLPEKVWLNSLTTATSPRGPGPRRAAGPDRTQTTDDERVVLDAPTILRLIGYAADHEHLYTFMSQLKQPNVFRDVELLGAEVEPALAGQAVRFELQCGW